MLYVEDEIDRRKHHLDVLGESSLFRPLIIQCLSKSDHRPTAVALCKALKKFGAIRKSTLKLTKSFEEEKIELTKQLKLQRDIDIQEMQKTQEQLQQEITALKTKLDEESKVAIISTKKLNFELKKMKAKLDDALHAKNELQSRLSIETKTQNRLRAEISELKDKVTEAIECQSLSTAKQLAEQNQKLTDLLESTKNNLKAHKEKSFSALKELIDSLNKEYIPLDGINDELQKCENNRRYTSVKLQDMENHLSLIKQSLRYNKGQDLLAVVKEDHGSNNSNEVSS